MESGLLILLEVLLVIGVVLGFAVREVLVLRRDKRKEGGN